MACPDSATVTVLSLGDYEFEVVGTYGEGDTVSSSVVEGFGSGLMVHSVCRWNGDTMLRSDFIQD